MDATTTLNLISAKFTALGGLVVTYAFPIGLTIATGFFMYYWGWGYFKRHFHG